MKSNTTVNTGCWRITTFVPMDRPTLVLGASPDPARYSHLATQRLLSHGHTVILVGARAGAIAGKPILTELPQGPPVHTVSLYMNPMVQEAWHERILALHPKRIIFNPGTEHEDFARRAAGQGIEVIEGCTLVMLATGHY